mmetsp:Transcript_97243/g.278346  ORF Transcript_97243/g.278346 Transcript_97243/m.278346 type:complete len:215 (-) Transcript_97243:622-1266(-)
MGVVMDLLVAEEAIEEPREAEAHEHVEDVRAKRVADGHVPQALPCDDHRGEDVWEARASSRDGETCNSLGHPNPPRKLLYRKAHEVTEDAQMYGAAGARGQVPGRPRRVAHVGNGEVDETLQGKEYDVEENAHGRRGPRQKILLLLVLVFVILRISLRLALPAQLVLLRLPAAATSIVARFDFLGIDTTSCEPSAPSSHFDERLAATYFFSRSS